MGGAVPPAVCSTGGASAPHRLRGADRACRSVPSTHGCDAYTYRSFRGAPSGTMITRWTSDEIHRPPWAANADDDTARRIQRTARLSRKAATWTMVLIAVPVVLFVVVLLALLTL